MGLILADTILIVLSVIVLLLATYFDIKTKEIPDWLSYGYVLSAIIFRLAFSFNMGFDYFFLGLIGFGAMFVLGLVLYYSRIWGGGDSKLLMGMGAAFGSFSIGGIHFLVWLLFSIVLVGGLYSFAWSLKIYFKNLKKANKELRKTIVSSRFQRLIILSLAFILLILSFFIANPIVQFLLSLLAIALVVSLYLHIFTKVIHEIGFVKQIPLSKVTEGDWLAKDVKVKGKTILSYKVPSLDKKHIKKLKRYKVKKVWIKEGIPFLPAMTLGTFLVIVLYGIL